MGVFKGSLYRMAGCFQMTAPVLQKKYKGNRNQFYLDYARLLLVVDHYEGLFEAESSAVELRWKKTKYGNTEVYELFIDHEEVGVQLVYLLRGIVHLKLGEKVICSLDTIQHGKAFVKKMLGYDDRKEQRSKKPFWFLDIQEGRR